MAQSLFTSISQSIRQSVSHSSVNFATSINPSVCPVCPVCPSIRFRDLTTVATKKLAYCAFSASRTSIGRISEIRARSTSILGNIE